MPISPEGAGELRFAFYAYTDTGLYTEDMDKEPHQAPTGAYRVIAGEGGSVEVLIDGVLEQVEEVDLFCSWWTVPSSSPRDMSQAHVLYKFQRIISSGEVRMMPSRFTFPGGIGTEVEV